jgi:protocatechuate 3,4-dioxygenase alpha subunit
VGDALVEAWQADPTGYYRHPSDDTEGAIDTDFRGFGRAYTDAEGEFQFLTLKPGPVPGRAEAVQAPHITLLVFARGLLDRLVTRVYFPEDALLHGSDPLLTSIGDEAQRQTLIARRNGDGVYTFDIHLQGDRETAFLAI